MVEVLKSLFTHIRNIACDFFRSKLRITGSYFKLVHVDRGEDVVLNDLLGDKNRIFEVITIPRHERHENVTTDCKLTVISGRTVRDHVAFLNRLAFGDNWLLIEASAGIRAHELTKVVDEDAFLRICNQLLHFRNFTIRSQHDVVGVN